MLQVHWLNSATSFALWTISSACGTLCSNVTGLYIFQVLLPAFLVGWGQELQSAMGLSMIQLPCVGRSRPGSMVNKTLYLRTQIKYTCTLLSSLVRPCHCLDSTDEQISWLGILLGCCKEELCSPRSKSYWLQDPPHFFLTIQFPVVKHCRFPCNLHEVRLEWGSQEVTHNARGAGCPPWAPFSHWRNHCLRGDLSVWCCTILGKGQSNQCIAAPFTLLMQSVLVSIVKLGGGVGVQLPSMF